MRNRLFAAVASAALVVSLSSPALAGDRDNARTAIAAAKAKVDLNEKNGVTGEAANVQAKARTALDKAQKEFDDSDEDSAQAAANEASALADLAASTQQKQQIESQTAAIEGTPN